MSKLFQKPEDLAGYLFRIVDNGGATIDRYTVIFSDDDYLGLSSNPSSPQGFSQWGENASLDRINEDIESGNEVDLALGDLPAGLVDHILSRCNEAYADFLDRIEADNRKAVAADRTGAEINEGIHTCGGVGIYRTSEGYRVRLDGEAEDDRGPYDTAREALLATLPDIYGMAGPEYHSTTDPTRLDPDDAIAVAIADLETRVAAGPAL